MIESNGFDNLDDVIQPTIDRSNKIQVLLEELIPIEKKLSEFGIEIKLIFNHQTLNLASKKHQDAMKLLTDSILNILSCQNDLGEYKIVMTEYAISILQKSLKIE